MARGLPLICGVPTNYALILFWSAAAADLTLILLGQPMLHRLYTKPILAVALMGYAFAAVPKPRGKVFTGLIVALVITFCADVTMLLHRTCDACFKAGILLILLQQLGYAILFVFEVRSHGRRLYWGGMWWRLPLALVIVVLSLNLLWQGMAPYRIFIVALAFCIFLMVSAALCRLHAVSDASFFSVIFGGILFMISCLLFGVDRFVVPLPMELFFVMSTYLAAQFLIVSGMVHQINLDNNAAPQPR
jgi:uncharacterized membrane protein YhhN